MEEFKVVESSISIRIYDRNDILVAWFNAGLSGAKYEAQELCDRLNKGQITWTPTFNIS